MGSKYKKQLVDGRLLLKFAAQIYELQLQGGRRFLHDFPVGATNWQETCMRRCLKDRRCGTSLADLCYYGMTTIGKDGTVRPARKRTRFRSTFNAVLEQLSGRCPGNHDHQILVDGRAKKAAHYPPDLCRAIIKGIETEKQREGEVIPTHLVQSLESGCSLYDLMPQQIHLDGDATGDLPHEQDAMMGWHKGEGGQVFWDGISGEALPPNKVRSARKGEIDFMESGRVLNEVPISKCWESTQKPPLDGRWVHANKGDDRNPDVRCRWVAKVFAVTKTDEFFVAMPPVEALMMLLSFVATGRTNGKGGRKIVVMDAKRAHPHAILDRDVFVRLPPEIRREGYCAHLHRCLYGTRDAPQRWEAFLASELKKHGFKQGVASACVFVHSTMDLRCVVHGDDFTFAGTDASLKWVEERMHESFLMMVVGKLGGDVEDAREMRVLNRILRWTDQGITYEADPRHVEQLVRDFPPTGDSVKTAGIETTEHESDELLEMT